MNGAAVVLALALTVTPATEPEKTATDYRLAYIDQRAATRVERAGRKAAEAERDAAERERDAAKRIANTRPPPKIVTKTEIPGWVWIVGSVATVLAFSGGVAVGVTR